MRISRILVRIAIAGLSVSIPMSSARAQSEVLSFASESTASTMFFPSGYTQFTFSQSMILNSIGFVTDQSTVSVYRYDIDNVMTDVSVGDLSLPNANGVRYFNLSTPKEVTSGSVLKIYNSNGGFIQPYTALVDSNSQVAGVVYNGMIRSGGVVTNRSGGNIRVSPSNPGSNVAPEPGTFALALIGGGALLGMCVGRRRVAS